MSWRSWVIKRRLEPITSPTKSWQMRHSRCIRNSRGLWWFDKFEGGLPTGRLALPVSDEPDENLIVPGGQVRGQIGAGEDGHDVFVRAGPVEEVEKVGFSFGVELGEFEVDHLSCRGGDEPFAVRAGGIVLQTAAVCEGARLGERSCTGAIERGRLVGFGAVGQGPGRVFPGVLGCEGDKDRGGGNINAVRQILEQIAFVGLVGF